MKALNYYHYGIAAAVLGVNNIKGKRLSLYVFYI